MIRVQDKGTGRFLGAISEEELQFLVDELEEESPGDTDYYIDAATIEMLEADGGDPTLIAFLRSAVGSSEGVEIQWFRTGAAPPRESPGAPLHSIPPELSPPGADEPVPDEPVGRSDEPLETVKVYGGGYYGAALSQNYLAGSFQLAQAVLRSAGIQFVATGNYDSGFHLPPEIRVRSEDAEEARRLLATLS